jgi:xanthine/uracil permease
VTGVRSRFVTAAGGAILIMLSLIPKLAAIVGAIPVEVLGGAGLIMFGMVAATGVRILSAVDFKASRNNLFIVAISAAFGLLTLIAPGFFKNFPSDAQTNSRFRHHPDDDRRGRAQRLLQRRRRAGRSGASIDRRGACGGTLTQI